MTIEINSFFSNISNSMYSAIGLNHVFSSVLYTSIFMTIIIIIMIIIIYPAKEDSPAWLKLKLFLYLFGAILIIFSVHYSFVKNDCKEKYHNDSVRNLMNNIHGGKTAYNDDFISVQPNLEQDNNLEEDHNLEQNTKEEPVSLSDIINDLEKKV